MSTAPSVYEISRALSSEDGALVKRVLEGGVKIPAQPRVIEELQRLLSRNEMDVRLLARTINQDTALTAMLFKVVGNAAYRQHQPFDNVEQILHAVGVRQTFNLMQAIAFASANAVSRNRQAFEAYWARSQAVGQIAMLIADERISVCNIFPDQAYMAGVFHDCGVPMLIQRFPTYCDAMQLDQPGRWTDLHDEDRKFNTNHCVVGYLVARHWCLPGFICDAIRYHHAIGELGDHDSRSMVAILQLAVEIYYRNQHVPNPEWERVAGEVLPELGLSQDSLPEFIDIILERYAAAGM